MQIGFSRFKGQPELIWKAADPVWFERFAETRSRPSQELSEMS
jgi:hypothetical protein